MRFFKFQGIIETGSGRKPYWHNGQALVYLGASMLSAIGKEMPRIVYKCQLCASDQVEAWAEPRA